MSENISNKENILRHALELFSSKGYEAVSVQELVNMAGITKPTLYYHFGSKEGVYEQLVKINYDSLDRMVATASVYEANPSSYFHDVYPILVKLVSRYFNFAKENQLFYRMVLSNMFQPHSSQMYSIVKSYHFKQYEIVERLFNEIATVHTNMQCKERMLTWSFLGMINSFIGFFYNELDYAELNEDLAKKLVKQFMHGIYS